MKITKGKLQQIIREELTRALSEQSIWYDDDDDDDDDDEYETRADRKYEDRPAPDKGKKEYVVIGNLGQGRQNAWPSSAHPGLYYKEEAEAIAEKQNASQGRGAFPIHYHVKTLADAPAFVKGPSPARTGITDRRDNQDNDLDTDNDGQISYRELKRELEDIKDDL